MNQSTYPPLEGVCSEIVPNSNMRGDEVHCGNTILWICPSGTVKIGDKIRVIRDEKAFYQEIYINDALFSDK